MSINSEPTWLGVTPGRRFQVLALDGGGAKALFTASLLARLEEDSGTRVVDAFDLITGTSAGGILAIGLGAGLRPAEIARHYESLVSLVFPSRRRRRLSRITWLIRAAYDQAPLREAFAEIFGDRRLGDSTKRLVIPAWDVMRGTVHLFKTPHDERLRRDRRIPMVDVALATSAAPGYLPAAHVDGHRLRDGGLWANNPSVVGIAEAISLGWPLEGVAVLNIGATTEVGTHSRGLDRAGFGRWARHAAPVAIAAATRGAQGIAHHLLNKDRYVRFDATVPTGSFSLDVADPEALLGWASGMSRELCPVYRERFANHVAMPYVPVAMETLSEVNSP